MITNERQYRIANAQLKRFEGALATQRAAEPTPDVAVPVQRDRLFPGRGKRVPRPRSPWSQLLDALR